MKNLIIIVLTFVGVNIFASTTNTIQNVESYDVGGDYTCFATEENNLVIFDNSKFSIAKIIAYPEEVLSWIKDKENSRVSVIFAKNKYNQLDYRYVLFSGIDSSLDEMKIWLCDTVVERWDIITTNKLYDTRGYLDQKNNVYGQIVVLHQSHNHYSPCDIINYQEHMF